MGDRGENRRTTNGFIDDRLIHVDHAEKIVTQRRRQTTEKRRGEDQTVLIG